MTRFVYIFLCIAMTMATAQCQQILQGFVLDEDLKPYVNIPVRLEQLHKTTHTREDGFYRFDDVPSGEYALSVDYGYDIEYRKVSIGDTLQTFTFNIERRIEFEEVALLSQSLGADRNSSNFKIKKDYLQLYSSEKDVPYLLQFLPSVSIQSDAGNGVGYTGIRMRGLDPSHIQVSMNGVPLTDAESSLTYFVDVPDIVSSTDEITVWKGNTPSRSGPGNFGAAIDLRTHGFQAKPSASLSGMLGSYGTWKYSIQANTGLVESKYYAGLTLSMQKSDGFIQRSASQLTSFTFASGRISKRSSVKLLYVYGNEKTDQAWYGLPVHYFSVDSLFRYNAAGFERTGEPYEFTDDNYRQQHFQFFYNQSFSKNGLLSFTFNYTHGNGYYENYLANASLVDFSLSHPTEVTADLARQKWLRNNFYFANLQYQFHPHSMIEFWCGLTGSIYAGQHFGIVNWVSLSQVEFLKEEYYKNKGIKSEYSPFVKGKWKVNDHVEISADIQGRGIQYSIEGTHDIYRNIHLQKSYFFIKPSVYWQWIFHPQWSVNGSMGWMTREPFREDILRNSSAIRVEKLFDNELGILCNWKKNIFKLNSYYMSYVDQLVLTGELNEVGEPRKTNVPNSYRLGLELFFEFQLIKDLVWRGSWNLSTNKILGFTEDILQYEVNFVPIGFKKIERGNTQLAFSPNSIANTSLSYTFFTEKKTWPRCQIQYNHNWVALQYLDNTSKISSQIPAYMLGGFHLMVNKQIHPRISGRISLNWNNIWNQKYSSHGWISRYIYPESHDGGPYVQYEGDEEYSYKGLYPQALRHWNVAIQFIFN